MTQTERNRFTILAIVLIVVVVAGIIIAQFRSRSEVGADILGIIQNQAVATYTDPDGVAMEPTLSDISQLTVSGGVGKVTLQYQLGKRVNQSTPVDIQFYRLSEKDPFAYFVDENGEDGSVETTLKNVPNDQYDISAKPLYYLSQSVKSFAFKNGGTQNLVEYKNPFLWGDIDVSNNGRGDNKINTADWSVLLSAWDTADPKADFNADGVVNSADASVMLGNWDKTGEQFKSNIVDDSASQEPLQ